MNLFRSTALLLALMLPGCVVIKDPLNIHYAPTVVTVPGKTPVAPKPAASAVVEPIHTVVQNAQHAKAPASGPGLPVLPPAPPPTAAEPKKPDTTVRCSQFQLPAFGSIPQIKQSEYDKIEPDDEEALNRLLVKNIQDLYRYSLAMQKRIREAHQAHLKDCKK